MKTVSYMCSNYLNVFSICAVLVLNSSTSLTIIISPSTLLLDVKLVPARCLNPPPGNILVSCILCLSITLAPSAGPTGPDDLILLTGPCLGPSAVLLLPSLPLCLLPGEEERLLAPG